MAEVINSRSTENVIRFLKKVHFELNIKLLISDSAKENKNDEISRWATTYNIKHHYISPYHHNSNGRIERFNRTIGESIRKQDNNLSLNQRVEKAVEVYNNTIHNATGLTPNEAMDVTNLSRVKQQHFSN
ncbi:hypothetical protein NGRA_3400, partial [Nosema granulosis]